ncbi:hypothetical protein JWZ98_13720 [Methylomonas sp. EFPC1]|uniref:hypothetical protein n=1 Tax=Methylomonas sp. EFPC1 TaxID=2812647 RepID=UPI0019670B64|nr:hypothetical protein [Methylomonas sp. EFPC1]QSA99744.1 hypothetical protein JWZ98_13720 [Methylomonas sp. EFPC1]
MPVASDVMHLIGNTPVVKLHKVVLENSATVLASWHRKTPAARLWTESVWL